MANEFGNRTKDVLDARIWIDDCTRAIIWLVRDRTNKARSVHAIKRDLGLPVSHPQREAEVIEHAGDIAEEFGLRRIDGRKIGELLIEIAEADQE